MDGKHYFNVNLLILNKEETFTLPVNIVKYSIILQEKYMDEYLKSFINVNFSKQKLVIMYMDPNRNKCVIEKIYSIIEKISGITEDQIKGNRRFADILLMRQLFHYVYMKLNLGSLKNAGKETDNDHTSVMNSVKKINECIEFGNGKRKAMYLLFMSELKKENILK